MTERKVIHATLWFVGFCLTLGGIAAREPYAAWFGGLCLGAVIVSTRPR